MDSIDLDISWVEKHERLLNIYENYQREHMDSIKICYIYVNLQSEIEKVICENEYLFFNGNYNVIPKERVLQIVQNKKLLDNDLKYTIDNILVYNVSIEPENIQKYVNCESVESFLKIYPIVDEIQLPPSIFIFHEINSIYFIFKQNEVKPKSILKNGNKFKENGKKTKRVRIQEDLYAKNIHNITKKNL